VPQSDKYARLASLRAMAKVFRDEANAADLEAATIIAHLVRETGKSFREIEKDAGCAVTLDLSESSPLASEFGKRAVLSDPEPVPRAKPLTIVKDETGAQSGIEATKPTVAAVVASVAEEKKPAAATPQPKPTPAPIEKPSDVKTAVDEIGTTGPTAIEDARAALETMIKSGALPAVSTTSAATAAAAVSSDSTTGPYQDETAECFDADGKKISSKEYVRLVTTDFVTAMGYDAQKNGEVINASANPFTTAGGRKTWRYIAWADGYALAEKGDPRPSIAPARKFLDYDETTKKLAVSFQQPAGMSSTGVSPHRSQPGSQTLSPVDKAPAPVVTAAADPVEASVELAPETMPGAMPEPTVEKKSATTVEQEAAEEPTTAATSVSDTPTRPSWLLEKTVAPTPAPGPISTASSVLRAALVLDPVPTISSEDSDSSSDTEKTPVAAVVVAPTATPTRSAPRDDSEIPAHLRRDPPPPIPAPVIPPSPTPVAVAAVAANDAEARSTVSNVTPIAKPVEIQETKVVSTVTSVVTNNGEPNAMPAIPTKEVPAFLRRGN
jgi:hypothetical protein